MEQKSINIAPSDKGHKAIPYGRQWIDDDDIQAVVDVLKSDWLTQGPKIKEFEEKFSEYCGAKYAVAVSSGTAALHLACLAAEIGHGDEVITSPITFAASANCALYVGAVPVFIDIDPETICLDAEKLEEYLFNKRSALCSMPPASTKPKAIIPVHFAGLPCDMDAISRTAKDNGLIVIEDACHALGGEYRSCGLRVASCELGVGSREQNIKTTDRVKVGSCKYSDMTVFSFHPVKHITTGEGGMITTNDPELYEKLLMLRTHGITKKNRDNVQIDDRGYYYEMRKLGFNYRLTDIQCALGISQLKKLDVFLEKRRDIAVRYNNELKELEDHIILPAANNGNHAWHLYVIQLKTANRDSVFRKLRECGIGVQVHYIPVYFHPYYKMIRYEKGLCPDAEKYFEMTITLPVYHSLSVGEQGYIISKLKEAFSYN